MSDTERPQGHVCNGTNCTDVERGRAVLVRFDPPDAADNDGGPMTVKSSETNAGEARTETPKDATTPAAQTSTREAPVTAETSAATVTSTDAAPKIEDLRPEFRVAWWGRVRS